MMAMVAGNKKFMKYIPLLLLLCLFIYVLFLNTSRHTETFGITNTEAVKKPPQAKSKPSPGLVIKMKPKRRVLPGGMKIEKGLPVREKNRKDFFKISGHLYDRDGSPLPSWSIYLVPYLEEDRPRKKGIKKLKAVTSRAGNFEFKVPGGVFKKGSWVVFFARDPKKKHTFRIPAVLTDDIILVPKRTFILSGRITIEENGVSSPGKGYISIYSKRNEEDLFMGKGKSDEKGRFQLDCIWNDDFRTNKAIFNLSDGKFLLRKLIEFREAKSQEMEVRFKVVKLGFSVYGGDGKKPLKDARIVVISRQGNVEPLFFPGSDAKTDGLGKAFSRVQEGESYKVLCFKKGYGIFHKEYGKKELDEKNNTIEILLDEWDEKRIIRGKVVSWKGKPLEKAVVSLFPTLGESGIMDSLANVTDISIICEQMRTGKDGKFELELPGTDLCELYVYHRDYGLFEKRMRIPRDEFLVINLAPTGTLRIEPVGGAGTYVFRDTQWECYIKKLDSNSEWNFRITFNTGDQDGLEEGVYRVLLVSSDGERFGEDLATVERGKVTRLKIHVDVPFSIEGYVFSKGKPAKGARIEIDGEAWPSSFKEAWASAVTDEKGRFEIFSGNRKAPRVIVRYKGIQWRGVISQGMRIDL